MMKSNLKLILKTKNEGLLLDKWIAYHSKVIGIQNLLIIDNDSDDEFTKEVYLKYKDLQVINLQGTVNKIHHIEQNKEIFQPLINEYRFVMNLDTDEFLCYYDVNEKRFNPLLIDEKLNKIEDNKSICTLWMHNTPKRDFIKENNFEDFIYFELNSLNLSKNLNYGKTIAGTNSSIFKDSHSILGHNNFSKDGKFYDNFFTFHFDRFDIKRRIKNNIFLTKSRASKLISRYFDTSYFDHLIQAIDDDSINVDIDYLSSLNNSDYHKLREIINFFKDKKKHIESRSNFNKNFYLQDNIVQSVINECKNIKEIIYDEVQFDCLSNIDFLKNILIHE